MELNDYQRKARSTATYGESVVRISSDRKAYDILKLAYTALGLSGEAGEVADKIKKIIRDDFGYISDIKRTELIKELGDVMWYVANIAHELGYDLDVVALINIEKLKSRQERDAISGEGDNR